jgi:hypothetical protein
MLAAQVRLELSEQAHQIDKRLPAASLKEAPDTIAVLLIL